MAPVEWTAFWSPKAQVRPDKKAIWDASGAVTYAELSAQADQVARALLDRVRVNDLNGRRVAFWIPPSIAYVSVQWGIWRAGGVAVPLCVQHPAPELEYSITESRAEIVVHSPGFPAQGAELGGLLSAGSTSSTPLPQPDHSWQARPAQILFTSGTTGKPKGAVATHGNLEAQVRTLIGAWGWSHRDHTLGVLPLHHTHGIVNVLCCALAAGASLELFEKFDGAVIWDRLLRPRDEVRTTLFMAVPTVYSRLADFHEQQAPVTRVLLSEAASKLRLWVSGSAALPVSMLERWRAISGHTLLERYGMTEIGMALSNPLAGTRKAGFVGLPLPSVEVRLVDEEGSEILGPDLAGEIQVRGPMVFSGYFGREQATHEAFDAEGWFKTGDQALRDGEGYYRILGRSSVDILKTGGYKVSALEIEEELRGFPGLSEICVVGIPDEKWGERVSAAYCVKAGEHVDASSLEAFARERLARYKVPTLWYQVPILPRNAMGKVLKPEVVRLLLSLLSKPDRQ